MAQVNIRMDDELKNRADELFEELGINMSTAVTMFVRQSVREGGIPFEITTNVDPFYSEANQAEIRRRVKKIDSGKAKMIIKTMDELEAMADG